LAIRKRTSKSVAKRHDLDYFKKGSPIRLWQWRLSAVALIIAGLWLIGILTERNATAFSSGPVSAPHAVFGQKCDSCHKPVIPGAGWLPVIGAKHNVPDSACESCHQVGPHHADTAVGTKSCSSCHIEHIGAMHLAAAPVKGCTQCHANLELRNASPSVAAHIDSFTKGHPDFHPLRAASEEIKQAAFGLKFNHEVHLKKDLAAAGGGKTTLQCSYCHRISDMGERGTAESGHMAEVDFEKSCRSCHTLEFDKRVAEKTPHTDAATVLKFVQEKMSSVAPGDTAALGSAEAILFRQGCALCHTVGGSEAIPKVVAASFGVPNTLPSKQVLTAISEAPTIGPSKQPDRFFSAAIFSHSAHSAVQCEECHVAARSSVNGTDLLLPGIATCQRCHDGQSNPQGALPSGHAESGCSLCHTYHEGGRMHGDHDVPTFKIDELVPSR
jgi:hypothetical protein